MQPITHRLRAAGYYTANVQFMDGKPVGTGKTDLNFEVEGEEIWTKARSTVNKPAYLRSNDQNLYRLFHSNQWADLRQNKPFFAQVNLPVVERGGTRGWVGSERNPWNKQVHPRIVDPAKVTVPPYYPDLPSVREDWAGYLDAVCGVDARCGEVLRRLEEDGLLEDTVVIFFGDNGRLELRGLDWCYDSGDQVPMIVRWPKRSAPPPQYRPGRVVEDVVSLLDVTATTLGIAGIPRPAGMQSRIFLGDKADPPRDFAFSARDRTDDAVNRIRALRGRRYRYIRNFMPEKRFMAIHRYKDASYPVVSLMHQVYAEGKLTPAQQVLMANRLPDEELYDLERDPYEITNLAAPGNSEHQRVKRQLRAALDRWMAETNDQGRIPEPKEVVDFWIQESQERHGTPEWRRGGER